MVALNPQTQLTNLADAEDEMMLSLDADERVPYLLGEVFLLKTQVGDCSRFHSPSPTLKQLLIYLKQLNTSMISQFISTRTCCATLTLTPP